MEVEFRLPDLGEGVADAEIVEWHVVVGDQVTADDELLDVQTDKAIVAIPSPYNGEVLRLGAEAEDVVAVGSVLVAFETTDQALTEATEVRPDTAGPAVPAAAPAVVSDADPAAGSGALASPAVRKLARERGVGLESISGSGPRGRILEGDLDGAPGNSPPKSPGAPSDARHSMPSGADKTVSLQGSRRVVAEAMSEAWRTIPHITDLREVDVAGLLRARRLLKERLLERGAEEEAKALTVFAVLAKVTAEVAAAHPPVNATVDIDRHEITYHGRVDLNVAVSTPNGLLAPVVRNADGLSLPTMALELGRLGAAAREGALGPADLARGTITASNYGSLGSPSGTTIIQPGQTAIVGFGHTTEKAVVRDGEIVVGSVMQVHCSGDHRAMDGLELQAFTAELAATLEDPVLLLAGRD